MPAIFTFKLEHETAFVALRIRLCIPHDSLPPATFAAIMAGLIAVSEAARPRDC